MAYLTKTSRTAWSLQDVDQGRIFTGGATYHGHLVAAVSLVAIFAAFLGCVVLVALPRANDRSIVERRSPNYRYLTNTYYRDFTSSLDSKHNLHKHPGAAETTL